MADPFVAEIRIFPFNFAPKGWAWCDGQLMPLSQNTALFALLGTFYGGDGKSTFALPDLQGRAAMDAGNGSGLSQRFLGESGGSETVTLLESEMPFHTHNVMATGVFDVGDTNVATNNSMAQSTDGNAYTNVFSNLTPLNFEAVGIVGSDFPHNNMMPYLTMYFNIALQGVFPPRG